MAVSRACFRIVVPSSVPAVRVNLPSHLQSQSRRRQFHSSPWLRFRAAAAKMTIMSDEALAGLKVNQDRLMETLHHTCNFGTGKRWGSAATEIGMQRLALSDSDKQVRDWFAETTEALGCKVTVDTIGNMFAVRPGRKADQPPTYAGSHLDTQPTGGRYDGILGVQAGVEMLKVLQDAKVETEFPVGVVNWTNEEGARFPISMVASGVWAEDIPLEQAHNLQEVGGGTATMKSELERIGYLGSTPASFRAMPMAAHFELHIEQGPILEANEEKIGVVQGVQAYRWFTIDIQGRGKFGFFGFFRLPQLPLFLCHDKGIPHSVTDRVALLADAHTGTTPLSARADAMLLAARCIAHSHTLATAHSALASTGILTLEPGSVNTIPGRVRFSLDIRSPRDSVLDDLEAALKRDFASLASGVDPQGCSLLAGSTPGLAGGLTVNWTTDFVSPATVFHEDCISAVREAASAVLGGNEKSKSLMRDMTSGAGHDSVYASRRCPTSMIFVPCRNGVSHNPEEFTSPEDCALGAEVLLQSVLRYDRLRARRAAAELER